MNDYKSLKEAYLDNTTRVENFGMMDGLNLTGANLFDFSNVNVDTSKINISFSQQQTTQPPSRVPRTKLATLNEQVYINIINTWKPNIKFKGTVLGNGSASKTYNIIGSFVDIKSNNIANLEDIKSELTNIKSELKIEPTGYFCKQLENKDFDCIIPYDINKLINSPKLFLYKNQKHIIF